MFAAGGFTGEGDVEAWAKVAEREASEELECTREMTSASRIKEQ